MVVANRKINSHSGIENLALYSHSVGNLSYRLAIKRICGSVHGAGKLMSVPHSSDSKNQWEDGSRT